MIDVAAFSELENETPVRVDVKGIPVCLVRVDDVVHAVHDVCTHGQASLAGGIVYDGVIECPRHGAQFSLTDGAVMAPPASQPAPLFPVEIRDGRVLVDPVPSYPHPFH